jgi:hypothetical protein
MRARSFPYSTSETELVRSRKIGFRPGPEESRSSRRSSSSQLGRRQPTGSRARKRATVRVICPELIPDVPLFTQITRILDINNLSTITKEVVSSPPVVVDQSTETSPLSTHFG